jgi:hypothetical protein
MFKSQIYFWLAVIWFLTPMTYVSLPESLQTQSSFELNEQDVKIEMKLSPLKNIIVSGQPLQLTVEIWNQGPADVYVCRDFETSAGPLSSLTLYLDDASGRHGSKYGMAGDISPWHKESLTAALARDWIALRRGHFYGAIINIDPDSFPWLRKPGTYRILGHYSSGGILAYQGTVLADPEEVAHLPARFWTGAVDSNSVVVRVISRKE